MKISLLGGTNKFRLCCLTELCKFSCDYKNTKFINMEELINDFLWKLYDEANPDYNKKAKELTKLINKHLKKQLSINVVSSNKVKFFCRLHTSKKNCREYRFNKNTCKKCPHFVEAK